MKASTFLGYVLFWVIIVVLTVIFSTSWFLRSETKRKWGYGVASLGSVVLLTLALLVRFTNFWSSSPSDIAPYVLGIILLLYVVVGLVVTLYKTGDSQ